jgi:hypothetical protein
MTASEIDSIVGPCPFSPQVETGRERQTGSVDKLIYDTVANHYDSHGLGNMHATTQSKSNDLKILEIQD